MELLGVKTAERATLIVQTDGPFPFTVGRRREVNTPGSQNALITYVSPQSSKYYNAYAYNVFFSAAENRFGKLFTVDSNLIYI